MSDANSDHYKAEFNAACAEHEARQRIYSRHIDHVIFVQRTIRACAWINVPICWANIMLGFSGRVASLVLLCIVLTLSVATIGGALYSNHLRERIRAECAELERSAAELRERYFNAPLS